MKALLSVAAVAAFLTTGTVMVTQAQSAPSDGYIRLAQMDSPGDGLDGPRAVREGNARPNRAYGAGPGYRMRYRRVRPYRRYRRYR